MPPSKFKPKPIEAAPDFVPPDDLIPVAEACKLLRSPRSKSGHPDPKTVAGWVANGLRIKGVDVKLGGIFHGKACFVVKASIQRFLDRCTELAAGPDQVPGRKEQGVQDTEDLWRLLGAA